jgi:catechol 2,3-dioxygenase-like lactoylglutathione lyase family enzyme
MDRHGLNILTRMAADRFDHVFVEPTSYDASIAFYRDTLGWRERFSWGGGGQPRGMGLASEGGMTIVLAERHSAGDHSKSQGINGTRPTLHLAVDDLDARHAALADVALCEPETTHWGTRWFVARDPDGNLIAFEQRVN